jgi:chaperone required for assembly of F1-ATPase
MSDWAPKRFWQKADVVPEGDQFAIALDGRPVNTPSRRRLMVPTQPMAMRIAAEWEAQVEKVEPTTMPWTRSANSAVDKVPDQRSEVETHLMGYADTDLLSYRAEGPEELIMRQAAGWDPVLSWVEAKFGVRLVTTPGVMPVKQDPSHINRLAGYMAPMSHFALTGFHDLVTLSGSYILAVAVAENELESEAGWTLSRIDEQWQIDQWGTDDEATKQSTAKKVAFFHAAEFLRTA